MTALPAVFSPLAGYYRQDSAEYFGAVEDIMLAHGGRPHRGKLHGLDAAAPAPRYPRFQDFPDIRNRMDPGRVFANDHLGRVLGPYRARGLPGFRRAGAGQAGSAGAAGRRRVCRRPGSAGNRRRASYDGLQPTPRNAVTAAPAPDLTAALSRSRWWGFLPFAAVSAVHIGARAAGAPEIAEPTKLLLMPLLAAAALWAGRGLRPGAPTALLLAALLLSWLGDGAGTFFPYAPELPVMLGSFGLAHLCYIWLLTRHTAAGPFPRWTLVFAVWWVLMLAVLWPALGSLTAAVAAYGTVLAGTAAAAARCSPVVAAGGVLFLASDTILALRIFMPGATPGWTNPLVMLTYCAGQALIVAGVLRTRAARRQAAS